MFRALLFDFNGVLVDDEPLHLELLRRVLAEEEIDLGNLGTEDLIGRSDREILVEILSAQGRTAEPSLPMRLMIRKATYYQEAVRRDGYTFFEGAQELLHETLERGLPVGVVSGALRQEIEDALDQLGVLHAVKIIVAAEDVEAGKPEPEGYLAGLAGLNSRSPLPSRLIHPHEVIALEDTPAGLTAASAASLVTLGIAHTFPASRLEELADIVQPRLAGLDIETLEKLYVRAAG